MRVEKMEDYLRWQKQQHQSLSLEGARTVQTTKVILTQGCGWQIILSLLQCEPLKSLNRKKTKSNLIGVIKATCSEDCGVMESN